MKHCDGEFKRDILVVQTELRGGRDEIQGNAALLVRSMTLKPPNIINI